MPTLHLQSEVGNLTSKFNAVARYRYSNFLRAITMKSDDVAYESRTITVRSNNDFSHSSAITIKSGNFTPERM